MLVLVTGAAMLDEAAVMWRSMFIDGQYRWLPR